MQVKRIMNSSFCACFYVLAPLLSGKCSCTFFFVSYINMFKGYLLVISLCSYFEDAKFKECKFMSLNEIKTTKKQ